MYYIRQARIFCFFLPHSYPSQIRNSVFQLKKWHASKITSICSNHEYGDQWTQVEARCAVRLQLKAKFAFQAGSDMKSYYRASCITLCDGSRHKKGNASATNSVWWQFILYSASLWSLSMEFDCAFREWLLIRSPSHLLAGLDDSSWVVCPWWSDHPQSHGMIVHRVIPWWGWSQ